MAIFINSRTMKPYIAKYLAAKGPINEGDLYSCPHKGHALEIEGLPLAHTPKTIICQYQAGKVNLCHDCYKIQLNLCLKILEVGSKVQRLGDGPLQTVKEINLLDEWLKVEGDNEKYYIADFTSYDFKSIAEISTDAKWVKENDEFDENEIELWWFEPFVRSNPCLRYTKDTKDIDWFPCTSMVVLAKIMGSCGHFH